MTIAKHIREDIIEWDMQRRAFPTMKEKADQHGLKVKTVEGIIYNELSKRRAQNELDNVRSTLRGTGSLRSRVNKIHTDKLERGSKR